MSSVSRSSSPSVEVSRKPPFLFAAGERLLTAHGAEIQSAASSAEGLSAKVATVREAARRAGHAAPWIVGALSFRGDSHFFVPSQVSIREARTDTLQGQLNTPGALVRRREIPAAHDYAALVEKALTHLNVGALDKIVLARALELEFERTLDPEQLFSTLLARNPSGYVFLLELPLRGLAPRHLVGASPELLIERRGKQIITHPLAGSIPHRSERERQAQEQRLLSSEKDRHEHAIVVREIEERLAPYCKRLDVPREPSLLATPHLLHLGTRIVGELEDERLTASQLAEILHPTPAVCGRPREAARALIEELEPFERDFFAGAIGYEEPNGDGLWAVSIRCAEVESKTLRLYAGAGIVPGSLPSREVEETETKLKTILTATLGAAATPRIELPGVVDWPTSLIERYQREGYWAGTTLGDLLRKSAEQFGEHTAVVCGARRLSYGALDAQVDRRAAGLLELGLRPGDRIVVQLPNRLEFIELCFALFRIGAIPVMALPGHRYAEISYFCEHTEAVAYVTTDRWESFDYRSLARRLETEHPHTGRKTIIVGEAEEFIAYADLDATPTHFPVVQASQVALLQLSGGSTGTPKLIPRTHDDYLYSVKESVRVTRLDSSSTYLVALPAAHNFTLSSAGILGALLAGSTVVFCPHPSPDVAFPLLTKERVTITALVPSLAQLWDQARESRQQSFPHLDVLQIGGAKLNEELARKIVTTWGCRLQQVFGMAEGLVNYTDLDDPFEIITQTQGRPLSSADEVRVVDDEDRDVPHGEVGHLITRGPYTIRGYYRANEHNQRAFTEDGFYRTGDRVRLTPDGSLVVEGRAKDQINRGGEKIAPEDVERHLLTHPDIAEAAVFGIFDALLGERTCACITTRAGVQLNKPAVLKHLRERGVAVYKLPDRVEFTDSLPKTSVGKIDKKVLRSSYSSPSTPQSSTSPSPSSSPAKSSPSL